MKTALAVIKRIPATAYEYLDFGPTNCDISIFSKIVITYPYFCNFADTIMVSKVL